MVDRPVGIEDLPELPPEYRELLVKLLLAHAEGELSGSDLYTQNLFPLAPTARERDICCRVAIDEIRHYVLTAKLLDDLGVDTSYMVGQSVADRSEFPLEGYQYDFKTWEERAGVSCFSEWAAHMQLENMASSSYEPLARICPGILRDEDGHIAHGWRILRDACQTPDGRARAQHAVDQWVPLALDGFGRSQSKRSAAYVHWGLKALGNEDLRQRFLAVVQPRIEELGLRMPDPLANRRFL